MRSVTPVEFAPWRPSLRTEPRLRNCPATERRSSGADALGVEIDVVSVPVLGWLVRTVEPVELALMADGGPGGRAPRRAG